MGFAGWLRTTFGAGPRAQFDEPRAARFSASYQPVNTLIEGLMRGIGTIGREEALSVPVVLRGRNLICSISTLPLEIVDRSNRVMDRPLLEQLDPNVENVTTLAMTVEDLLFEATAWWRITGFDEGGYPSRIERYEPGQVSMNPPTGYDHGYLPSGLPTEGTVWMAGQPVPWSEIIRFSSPNPPLLVSGRKAIKRAIALDLAAQLYAANPRRRGFFAPTEGADPVDDDTVQDILDAWHAGSTKHVDGYVPAALSYTPIQDSTPAELQLTQMQQRASLDLVNALGIDPEDVGLNVTSRTYQNATDRRKDKINETLAPYMRVIVDRLSMPDVTRQGEKARFALDDYLKADPRTRAEVAQIYAGMGVTDAAEVREQEGLPPRAIQAPAAVPTAAQLVPRRVNSTVGEPVQLSADPHTFAREGLTFDYDMPTAGSFKTFAVDQQARTITGLAVPWGQVARSGGRRYRFAKGSVKWNAVNRVKLLRDHVNSSAIGKALSLTETDEGLVATFHVSAGRAGDEALQLAVDEVLDGLSIGVDFRDSDLTPDPQNPGAFLVTQAALREVSLTAVPAFDDSRLTSVTAAREETGMPEETTETVPAEQPVTFSADQFAQFMQRLTPPTVPGETVPARPTVDPTTRPVATTRVNEPLPYRFDRAGNIQGGQYNFSTDLLSMARGHDNGDNGGAGPTTDAGRRAMALVQADFATVAVTNVDEVNPSINRPDMWVDKRDYAAKPLWASVNKGAPPNGVTPFIFPKYNSSGTLVADHVEGTEPTSGAYTTTSQTVTPTAISGKASLTREVWDQGGNPAVSQLIRNQMRRDWFEQLETATGTFLNTLTAAADIALGVAVVGDALADAWEAALADLQYVRGGDLLTMFAIEQYLYKAFVGAEDSTGRPLYPILGPTNTNGTSSPRFRTIDLSGVTGIPAWGLGAGTGGALNNSWLYDPQAVHGWATAPMYFDFPGTASAGGYAPLAMVDIAVWGYKAFANSDINGVRQVTYDNA